MTMEKELLARIEELERDLREWKGAPIVRARLFRVIDAEGKPMAELADDTKGGVSLRMGQTDGVPPIFLHVPNTGAPFIGICAQDGTYTAGIFIRECGQPTFQLRERDGTVRASIGIDEDGSTSMVLGDRSQNAGIIAKVDANGAASIRVSEGNQGEGTELSIPVVPGTPDFSAEEVEFPFVLGPRLLSPTPSDDALRRMAASGDSRALHDLALDTWDRARREDGGHHPDGDLLREATGLFRKAADTKLPEAMFALGVIACTVVGMKNVRDALDWFKDAAAAGHKDARKAANWIVENYREFVDVVRK